jgi:hypothetical protein
MKNEITPVTNLSTYTVKRLKTRGPRKGELWSPAQGGGNVVGAVRSSDSNAAGVSAGTNGARMTMTKQKGIGAEMVANLSKVKRSYDQQVAADRKAAARDRAAQRALETSSALDELLADIRA